MKIMKRIAVCLLAFVMAFSVNIPARAAADGELTVENYGDNNENIRISGKDKSLIVEIEMELNGNAYDTTIKLTNTSVTRKLRKYKVELDISGLSYNNNAANNAFGGSDRIPFVFSYYSGWSGPAVFTIKDLDGGQNLKTEEEMKILQPGATLTYSGKFFEKVWGEEPSVKGKSVSVDVTEKVEGCRRI